MLGALNVTKVRYGFFSCDATALLGPRPPRCWGFEITHIPTTLGRTPVEEGSARHRDVFLTTHIIHKRQTSMSRQDSNPQSQQARRHRSTTLAARPLGSAKGYGYWSSIFTFHFIICPASQTSLWKTVKSSGPAVSSTECCTIYVVKLWTK
jgi:hypothetical protein